MARPGRELSVPHNALLTAQDLFCDRDTVLLENPLCEVDKPPPNHAMDRRYRTSLDHRGKRAPVVITELRALTWRLAVDQPIRSSRIKQG